jgi:DNA-binding NtrC family response regulator
VGRPKILLLDDDKNLLRVLSYHIREAGFDVSPLSSPSEALEILSTESFDLVVTDFRMPEMDGIEFLRRLRARDHELPVIVLTAYGSIDKAVEAVRQGASDFLSKPIEKAQLLHAIRRVLQMVDLVEENRRLTRAVEEKFEFKGIVGSSKRFREVLEMASQLAAVDTTVLIQGESGTGKELLARAIHRDSTRSDKPFVAINCAALPEGLAESELFGHAKGAFTGAVSDSLGHVRSAHGGTLFLDEVGELSLTVQAKLLRFLESGECQGVGQRRSETVDARVLAATNRGLRGLVKEGRFREDLFYRLNVVPLELPPLRERTGDLARLLRGLTEELAMRHRLEPPRYTKDALAALEAYPWPGNVRELRNFCERMLVLFSGRKVEATNLPREIRTLDGASRTVPGHFSLPDSGIDLAELEVTMIRQALDKTRGNRSRAARLLGISRDTLLYRLKKYAIQA